jgi:hypothetical protein
MYSPTLLLQVLAVKLVSIHRRQALLAAHRVLEVNISQNLVQHIAMLLQVVTSAPAAQLP